MPPFSDLSPSANIYLIVVCGTIASILGIYLLRVLTIRRLRALTSPSD